MNDLQIKNKLKEQQKLFLFYFLLFLALILFFPHFFFFFSLKCETGLVLYVTTRVNHLLFYLLACVLFIRFYFNLLIYKGSLQTVLPLCLRSVSTILNAPRCVATMEAGEHVCACVCMCTCEIALELLSLQQTCGRKVMVILSYLHRLKIVEFGGILIGAHCATNFFSFSNAHLCTQRFSLKRFKTAMIAY